jgi:ribosome-binding ATPase YchF (GTP1/OBG family)
VVSPDVLCPHKLSVDIAGLVRGARREQDGVWAINFLASIREVDTVSNGRCFEDENNFA